MTVASTARRAQFTVGSSGQQGPYAFSFKVLDEGDLAVYVGSTTSSTLKTLTTHYTVSLSADGTGSITFASGQFPTTGQLVTIVGDKAYSRTTDFTAGGDIRAATLNSDGDAQTIFAQQLDENLTRSIQVPIFGNRNYTSDGPLLWPYDSTSNNANKLVAYNSSGNALELTDKAVSAATVSASNVATSSGAPGTATASVSLSGAGALAFALGLPIGQTGMTGGISMQYSTTTADADPGAGFIRFNNTSLNSATIMYVDDSDGTTDISAWVQSWDDSNSPNRGFITIAGNPNPSSPLAIFKVNGAVTDASGYTKIPVAYVAGSTSITNNAEVSVQFSPSGDGDYAGLDYVFSTTTTDSDPGAGTVRLNHGTLGSVTAIYIDDADANTADVEDYLLSWDDSTNLSDRGLVRVTKKTAPANYALYKISGASTDASGYVKLAVTHVDSNGSFSDADTVAIEFAQTGNIGIPAGLNLTYSTTTTDSDPGAGVIRFNNATLSSASAAYVDDADSAGANIEAYVLSWDDSTNTALRGTITLTKRDDPAVFAIWNITGASTDASGYSKLALTYVTGTGSFTNNDAVVLSFVRTGNAGSDASDVFKTISVSGQSDVVADSATDTLTLAAGSNITITTNAGTDTITIAAAAGASLANDGNDRVVTATGSGGVNGEANLTFDGSQLAAPDGSAGAPSITNTGDLNTGVFFPAADTVGIAAGGTEKFRVGDTPYAGDNLLDNGDMSIHQRGGTISVNNTNLFTLDRWYFRESTGSSVDVSQSTDVPTSAEAGTARSKFGSSLYVDATGASGGLGANDFAFLQQTIEAQYCQDLGYGAAGAKPVTLSFWVKTNKTGQYGVSLYQEDGGRHYTSSYTVSGTGWAFYSVTFPGDASGTINNDTGGGLAVRWHLSTGSNYHATAGSWTAGTKFGSSGDVDGLDSGSNEWRLTGAKLEIGSVPTSFRFRPPGGELAACRRYYERLTPNTASNQSIFQAYNVTSTVASGIFNYEHKRAAPTLTFTAGATFEVRHQTTTTVCTAAALSGSADEDRALCNFTVSSGLTGGQGCIIRRNDSDTTYVEVSAEL